MSHATPLRVRHHLGAYPLHISPDFGGFADALLSVRRPGPCVVLTAPPLLRLWWRSLEAQLRSAGFSPTLLLHPDGEGAKSLAVWGALAEQLLALRVERDTPLICLGGGVTGDLGGFLAATVLRGLPFIQVPTSLLAMVDSSVGGKVGINTDAGKNLLGSFYAPELVFAPLGCLSTLPPPHLLSGLGEIAKHAALQGGAAMDALEAAPEAILACEPQVLRPIVVDSLRFKIAIVERDEREQGLRALLNLGHTVGHALETYLSGSIPHGICVFWGLLAETAWAARHGGDLHLCARLRSLMLRLGVPKPPSELDFDHLYRLARGDKKRSRGMLLQPVVSATGEASLVTLPLTEISQLFAYLEDPCAFPSA
jgi:3-dehydroquinate synthetase